MARKPPEETLVDHLDAFFLQLMTEAYPPAPDPDGEGQKVGFVERVRLFDSGVRWVMIKNKVDPEEEEGAFATARKRAIGGPRRRRATGPKTIADGISAT